MTKTEFKKLCYEYQKIRNGEEFSEDFDAYGLVSALEAEGVDLDDLHSHEAVKDWLKYCIDEEYNIGSVISNWYNEGFADYYQVDMSMGTWARINALATAEDFYNAFCDYVYFEDDGTEWDPFEEEEEDDDDE